MCTFQNPAGSNRCGMCGSEKPTRDAGAQVDDRVFRNQQRLLQQQPEQRNVSQEQPAVPPQPQPEPTPVQPQAPEIRNSPENVKPTRTEPAQPRLSRRRSNSGSDVRDMFVPRQNDPSDMDPRARPRSFSDDNEALPVVFQMSDPPSAPQTEENADTWTCSECTFVNTTKSRSLMGPRCEMCGTPRNMNKLSPEKKTAGG